MLYIVYGELVRHAIIGYYRSGHFLSRHPKQNLGKHE